MLQEYSTKLVQIMSFFFQRRVTKMNFTLDRSIGDGVMYHCSVKETFWHGECVLNLQASISVYHNQL